jgi:hypothetical protein
MTPHPIPKRRRQYGFASPRDAGGRGMWGKFTGNHYQVLRGCCIVPSGCWDLSRSGSGGLQDGRRMGKAATPPARSPSLVRTSGTVPPCVVERASWAL